MSAKESSVGLTKKDFTSDQIVRWCPGCGDYAILAQVQSLLPELGLAREKYAFVSGIGCAARFPYYMNTYGFHTIHGRAPAIATGLKAANPELSVWVVTGDGDALSIGGNHLIHAIRRNVDLKLLLFDNRIYGLTKGQYSPTSRVGQKTPSTPWGSIDNPIEPVSLVLASEATFVARTVDRDLKHMKETFRRASQHRGTAFVQILQNCPVFYDGAYQHVTDKEVRDDNVVYLEHVKPLVFGKNHEKGLRLVGASIEVVELGNGVSESDLIVHDETTDDATIAFALSRLDETKFPVPLGVFRTVERITFHEQLHAQVAGAKEKIGPGSLEALLNAGDTWEVN
ncbi:MAG: 2-oxoacid:ferredoxin oxidoreductase subunit beta [Nitrospinae bacterium]|nr:2-oxoacid:ferredoxin oxidoreductase subunit beta [Nitrospinota bacterium]